MGYLISTNKKLLQTLQNKIHNYMKANIEDYKADKWSTIIKHPTENNYAILIKENDVRLPYNAITNDEKLLLIENLPDGWIIEVPNP